MTEALYCEDCKHCVPARTRTFGDAHLQALRPEWFVPRCSSPEHKENLIERGSAAISCEEARKEDHNCGKEAKWFEEKE